MFDEKENTTENDEARSLEEQPKYKKQAKTYIFIILGLLVAALFFDTFRRAKDDERTETPETVKEEVVAPIVDSQNFDDRFSQALSRRKTETISEQTESDMPSETLQQTTERLEAERDAIERGLYAENKIVADENQVDIEQQFKEQERRRAMNARMTAFNMTELSQTYQDAEVVQASDDTLKTLDALELEKNRVSQELERLTKTGNISNGTESTKQSILASSYNNQETSAYNSQVVGKPASEITTPSEKLKLITTGTVINAVLDQTLMSDYTGAYRGIITHDVYDVTGNSIVIPKGCRFTGESLRISNVNEPIQARMGLTAKWVILPNGKRISFEKAGMMDRAGISAVKDKVNYHFFAQFMGVAAYALLSSETSREGTGISNDDTYEGEVGDSLREQFAPLAAKYLSLVPTITLRAGTPIKIFLEDDIYAEEWSSVRERIFKADMSF